MQLSSMFANSGTSSGPKCWSRCCLAHGSPHPNGVQNSLCSWPLQGRRMGPRLISDSRGRPRCSPVCAVGRYVVTPKMTPIVNIQAAIRDDRVGPSLAGAVVRNVGRREVAMLAEPLGRGFDERDVTVRL